MLTQISKEEFWDKYLLGKQVAHQGVRSFEARDTADRDVMVHILGAVEGPEAVPWLAALSALTPERRSGLLGAFQIDGDAILVTESIPQVRSLADWFVNTAGDRKVKDQTSSVQDGDITSEDTSPGQDAGEFTHMFAPDHHGPVSAPPDEVPTEILPRLEDPADPEPHATEAAQTPVKQTGQDGGEFTRMFGAQEAGAPARSADQPEELKPAAASNGSVTPGTDSEKKGGEFTEFFGSKENTDLAPLHAQMPVEPSLPASPPPQKTPPKPRDEKRKAGPRIVWRDKKPKEIAPEPGQPETKVQWKKGSPPGATDARAPMQPELKPPQAPSVFPTPPDPVPPPPSAPAPSQPPGQFTEIFGHALPQGSKPGPPTTGGSPKSDRQIRQPTENELHPPGSVPQISYGKDHGVLADQTSNDYLRALGSDSQGETPPAAPMPESVGRRHDRTPDLPPPVAKPKQETAPGPSDYTRVVSGRPAVPPPAAPAPAPAPSPGGESEKTASGKVPTWLWVALVVIVLVMVLLIVVVVLT